LWHILPKPKDPPTSDEIVAAIKKAVAPTPEGNPARTSSPKRSIFVKSPPTADEIAEEVMRKFSFVSNNDLRQETAAYTKELRDMERRRGEAYSMTRKPMNLQPGAEERNAHWWAVEDQVKERFGRDYRDK